MFLKQWSGKALFLYLSWVFISTSFGNDKITVYNPQNINCNKTYDKETGNLAYIGKQSGVPENINCSWFFEFPPNDADDIYMEVKNFALYENDSFVIKNRNSGKIIFGPFTGFLSPFVIATGTRNVEVQLITSPKKYNYERNFLINYSLKDCFLDLNGLQSGVIGSPVYNVARSKPLQCRYKLQGYRTSQKYSESLALSFMNLTLSDTEINITSSSEKDVISSNSPDFPKIFFGKGVIFIDINLDTKQYDHFRILYEVVPDACSGTVNLNTSNPSTSVKFSSPINFPDIGVLTRDIITCNWLIKSPPGTRIQAAFSSLQLLSLDDVLVISSPQYEQFSPLHVSAHNNHLLKDKLILSPTNEFWVKFTTKQILSGLNFAVDFSIFRDNGLNENRGTLTIKNLGNYVFKVPNDKVVNVELNEPIGPDTILDLYSHLENSESHFLTLDEKYTLKWIISPTNELKMVVKQLEKGKKVKLQFYPTDIGCNQTIVDNQGMVDIVTDCRQKCFLIVPSKISSEIYNFNIESSGGSLNLSSLNKNYLHLLDVNYPIKINVPVQDGVLIEFSKKCDSNSYDKSTAKISYLTQKSCGGKFRMSVGETLALSSVNYPDNFPLNANCHWFFEPNENEPMFYYITFSQFIIRRGDIITFKTDENQSHALVKETYNSRSSLPDDIILKSAFDVSFESRNFSAPFIKSYKFSLEVKALDCGGIKTSSKGVLTIKPGMVPHLCIWLISVPLKAGFDYTNVLVNVFNKRSGITVYDGPTIRSPIVKFLKDEGISSSNKILILYEPGIESLENFKIEYDSIGCNKTLACATGSCMKVEWKCNNVNECGDYSDELECPFTQKTTINDKTDSTIPRNLISTISSAIDVTTVQVDYTTIEVPDITHKEQVTQADKQISVTTMAVAVIGCVLATIILVTIVAYIVHKRILKKSSKYKNRWETLSNSNPSYQSEKDCVRI